MSYLYFNRIVATGSALAVASLEDAFRAHAVAVKRNVQRGRLSRAFGECEFAPSPIVQARDEKAACDWLDRTEKAQQTAVIRPYPNTLRVHFVTNWLNCHREVKRLARKFPVLKLRLDWMNIDENITGRLIVIGDEIECDATAPMWLCDLYVIPGSDPAGHWEGFHSLGNQSIFQRPVGSIANRNHNHDVR